MSGYYPKTTMLFIKYFTDQRFNIDIFKHSEITIIGTILHECLYQQNYSVYNAVITDKENIIRGNFLCILAQQNAKKAIGRQLMSIS